MASIFSMGSSSTGSSSSPFAMGSTSSTTPPGYMPPPVDPPDEGGGLLGLLGNVWEGVVGVGQGIGSLIGTGLHDEGRFVAEMIPGEQNLGIVNDSDDRGYLLDDVGRGMAGFTDHGFHPLDENSVVGDIWNRWSPLGPGGRPANETFKMMYEKPVSFGMDVAAVAGGVTKAVGLAAKAGGLGGEISVAARGAAALGDVEGLVAAGVPRTAAQALVTEAGKKAVAEGATMGDAVRTGTMAELSATGTAPRTAEAAATRAGLEAAGSRYPLTKILPQVRPRLVGDQLVVGTSAYNPLYRTMLAPVRRLSTETLESFAERHAASFAELNEMPAAAKPVADMQLWDRTLNLADQMGATRLETPWFSNLNLRLESGRTIARLKAQSYTHRDDAMRQAIDTYVRYGKDDPSLLVRGAVELQGLNINFGGMKPEQWLQHQSPETIEQMMNGPEIQLGQGLPPEPALVGAPPVAPLPGTPLYRGTGADQVQKVTGDSWWDAHTFGSTSESDAQLYGPDVETMNLLPEARVLRQGTPEYDAVAATAGGQHKYSSVAQEAERQGYDAVMFKDQGAVGTIVLNEDMVQRGTIPQYPGQTPAAGNVPEAPYNFTDEEAGVVPEPEVPGPKTWAEMSEEERIAADPVYAEWARLGPRDEGYGADHLKQGDVRTRVGKDESGAPTLYDEQGQAVGLPPQRVEGSERPLDYVYRVVDEREYQEALERGYLQSKGDMNLSETEGTVASHNSTGSFYFPRESEGRILKIRVFPEQKWKLDADGYVKTQEQIPMDAVHDVSRKIESYPQKPGDPNVRTQNYRYAEDEVPTFVNTQEPWKYPPASSVAKPPDVDPKVWADVLEHPDVFPFEDKSYKLWESLGKPDGSHRAWEQPRRQAYNRMRQEMEDQGIPYSKEAGPHDPASALDTPETPLSTSDDVTGATETAGDGPPGTNPPADPPLAAVPEPEPYQTRMTPETLDAETVRRAGPMGERSEVAVKRIEETIEEYRTNRKMMEESGWDVDAEIDGAERLKRAIIRGAKRRAEHDSGSSIQIPAMTRLQDELRLLDFEGVEKGFTGGIGMTPRMVVDRAYRPLLAKYGLDADWGSEAALKSAEKAKSAAEREIKSLERKIAKGGKNRIILGTKKSRLAVVKKQLAKAERAVEEANARLVGPNKVMGFKGGPSMAEVDDALADADVGMPIYFAHIDATRLPTHDWFSSRMEKGANKYAKNPHDEQMKLVLLKDGKWLKDPIEVAKRRAARGIREDETYALWDMITRKYGTEISSTTEVPDGYKLVAPDMLFVNHKTRTGLLDKLDENMMNGMDRDSAVAQALKETMTMNEEAVKALHDAGQVKMYAVPESVLKHLDEAAKWSPAFGGKNARLWMDTPMNIWRGLTLTASPRWVINNVLGNIAFSLMQGVKTADVVRIFTERYRVLVTNFARRHLGMAETSALRKNSLAQHVQDLPGSQNIGRGFIGTYAEQATQHLGQEAAATHTGQFISKIQGTKKADQLHRLGGAVKSLNATIEDSFREASFLTAAEKGVGMGVVKRTIRSFSSSKKRMDSILKKGFDESSGALALKEVNHFFGDYGSMSPFERHVVRRWLFPFWGFYRHTIKLMVTYPFEYPGKALLLEGVKRVTDDMKDQYGPMPEWLDSSIPLGPPGTDAFLSTRGANPFSGAAEGLPGVLSMLGPLPQTLIEQGTGNDTFTGQPFTDANTYTPFGSDQQYNLETGQPVDKVAPGLVESLLSSIPQWDMAKDALAGGRTYDTASMMDALQQRMGNTGEASPINPDTGEPYSPVDLAETLSKMFGISITNYDLAAFQERLAEDQRAVALEAARRMGAA